MNNSSTTRRLTNDSRLTTLDSRLTTPSMSPAPGDEHRENGRDHEQPRRLAADRAHGNGLPSLLRGAALLLLHQVAFQLRHLGARLEGLGNRNRRIRRSR